MLDRENLQQVYSAYVNYMSHFTPQSNLHALQLSKTFFQFFASNRYVINLSFQHILTSTATILSTVKIIRRFIIDNDVLPLQELDQVFRLFVPDFSIELLQKIQNFYAKLPEKVQIQRMLAVQSISQFVFVQLLKANFELGNSFPDNYKNDEFIQKFAEAQGLQFDQNIFDSFEQFKNFVYDSDLE
ncbi:hypothetical protein SS50377_24345 [Spironucleus salmonicida]|uniref:Uncharacterized protein n=1 Tax=Spironucleus salmonicida TaxID=348837 RepID=V6LPD4_9EUKA|nr:hypothetical protein SS50377_24345 [Spironucleus salmonicida]|eukprot:EST46103.1 Hypothetical protein SS50377_14097 [Spironucleus salmonicida]